MRENSRGILGKYIQLGRYEEVSFAVMFVLALCENSERI